MSNQNKNKGFSLIELLLAITILSIVMIMVTQFMGISSVALTKTKKNLNIQTEAMEVGNKISDVLMQATYIRVRTQDGETYRLNLTLDTSNKKQLREVSGDASGDALINQDLVIDNYPNYLDANASERKIILNTSDYTLQNEGGVKYPLTGSDEDQTPVKSFRLLSSEGIGGSLLYVKPQYIYVHYDIKSNDASGNANVSGDASSSEDAYMLLYFKDNDIYMDRGTIKNLESKCATYGFKMADGFQTAIKELEGNLSSQKGLLTEHIVDCYFSADSEANMVYLNMMFEDSKYKGYNYNYNEALLLRNSNVLTVEPEKMFKKKNN